MATGPLPDEPAPAQSSQKVKGGMGAGSCQEVQPDRAPSGGHKCFMRLIVSKGHGRCATGVPSFEDTRARPWAARGRLCCW